MIQRVDSLRLPCCDLPSPFLRPQDRPSRSPAKLRHYRFLHPANRRRVQEWPNQARRRKRIKTGREQLQENSVVSILLHHSSVKLRHRVALVPHLHLHLPEEYQAQSDRPHLSNQLRQPASPQRFHNSALALRCVRCKFQIRPRYALKIKAKDSTSRLIQSTAPSGPLKCKSLYRKRSERPYGTNAPVYQTR